MFDLILVILAILWLTGNFAFHVGSLIHLLLVLFVVVLIFRLLQSRTL